MVNQGWRVKDDKWLEHIMLGYNYRLDEMSCVSWNSTVKKNKRYFK